MRIGKVCLSESAFQLLFAAFGCEKRLTLMADLDSAADARERDREIAQMIQDNEDEDAEEM